MHRRDRRLPSALVILISAFAFAFSSFADGGVATASAAEVVKVRAGGKQGRSVIFRARGVEPEAIKAATLRSGRRSRSLRTSAVRADVRGKVRAKVSRRDIRRLRSARRRDGRAGFKRWLRRHVLVLRVDTGSASPVPPGTLAPATLVSAERLASLPTSGPAWDYMKGQADLARANMDLDSSPSPASPWLPNYNGTTEVRRPGVQTLAAALVYARTGQSAYRDLVIRANRYLIGSENSASTDGTAANDRTLATARNIGAYVVAADLVGMDPATTGSRSGYTATRWDQWLAALRTKTIGAPANCNSIVACSNMRAHNWGAFATGARIAIDIYLGDSAELATAVSRYQRFLGESNSGSQWQPSSAFDPTYACVPSGSGWIAINPADCGAAKNGMIVEDISRSTGSFNSYDKTGIGYTTESYQALLFSAILLERQGFDPFAWGDRALRRVMEWLEREGVPQGNGTSVERHQSWVANHFYGGSFTTVPAAMGRTLGFTDWLFEGQAPDEGTPDTSAPVAPTGLIATPSDLTVQLDWKSSVESDVVGYRVYLRESSGLTAVGWPAVNTFTHGGLAAETTYSYVVKGIDAAGNLSPASNPASATTPPTLSPNPPAISLAAKAYKVKGVRHAELRWAGAEATSVSVWRNGVRITTTTNDGTYTDKLGKGGGTFRYKICDETTGNCSAEVSVNFA